MAPFVCLLAVLLRVGIINRHGIQKTLNHLRLFTDVAIGCNVEIFPIILLHFYGNSFSQFFSDPFLLFIPLQASSCFCRIPFVVMLDRHRWQKCFLPPCLVWSYNKALMLFTREKCHESSHVVISKFMRGTSFLVFHLFCTQSLFRSNQKHWGQYFHFALRACRGLWKGLEKQFLNNWSRSHLVWDNWLFCMDICPLAQGTIPLRLTISDTHLFCSARWSLLSCMSCSFLGSGMYVPTRSGS